MEDRIRQILKQIKLNEETISMILGALVVIIVGVVAFNYFNNLNRGELTPAGVSDDIVLNETENGNQDNGATPQPPKVDEGETPAGLPTKYKVQAGDNLWKIAERYYGSGYNWVDIAQANNLANPGVLNADTELQIPKVEAKKGTSATIASQPATNQDGDAIEGGSYTVQKGDSLWKIAVRAYGDGYKWSEIYNSNKDAIGANPGRIFSGTQLTLPR